ncbi:tol-pal system YbgF family protein [Malonomonas rubra]|uniref:tetratricopeptide repeat protein n=1 Tax=Malonomonas rubra TaxID=57040 RepID=UPI0026F066F0|nr:tetratricopeptide repeat protein [Malonomonas rubra]
MPATLFLLLLLFWIPQPLFAAETDLFSFAESLAAEKDHYRAITEYKRFLHYYPKDNRVPKAQLAIAKSLLAGERWLKADEALEKVWRNNPASPEAKLARELYARAAFERGDYPTARKRYQSLKKLFPATAAGCNYNIGRSYLEENRLPEAEKAFAELPSPEAEKLEAVIEDFRSLPRKSPPVAGTLSAILPGTGQLYTERPKQAGVAFALNAAFIYGSIEAWNNDNYAVAGILSLFEIGWYGGNIYNAMNNAHKINRAREEQFKQLLQKRGGLSLGFSGNTPWLQARFHF